uniref:Uncharacterized protein n=1 Tax=Brassica oleracea var. oleracea TaxID=109376 RepID=A0A0D3A0Q4_BRAOL
MSDLLAFEADRRAVNITINRLLVTAVYLHASNHKMLLSL